MPTSLNWFTEVLIFQVYFQRRLLLAVFNVHLYHQNFNITKEIWIPKHRIGVLQLTFPRVLVWICFAGTNIEIHQNALSRRRIWAKQMQKPIQTQNWTETPAGRTPGSASSPPEQGGGHWADLGCGRTAPIVARAHLALAVHSMLGEAVACGAFQKYMSDRPLSSYKRSPLLTFMRRYTFWRRRRRATHISFSF
jgi:hypothetical protein